MNWEAERHDWSEISPDLAKVPELLENLLYGVDAAAVDHAHWRLNDLVAHNQVLMPGSPEVASVLIQALPGLAARNKLWALELLGQFLAGTFPPTAAAPEVVSRMIEEMAFVVPPAAQMFQYGTEDEASLCVDILEMSALQDPRQGPRISFLFRKFSARGESEKEFMNHRTWDLAWQ